MSDGEGELLPIAEAARRLRVSERRLRHLLARPEYGGRTRRTRRNTATGTRHTTVMPPDLFADLARQIERETNAANAAAGNGTQPAASDSRRLRNPAENAAEGGAMALVYERLLAEKDARLAEQAARIAFLEDALQREQENRARELALRALPPAPMPAEDQAAEQAVAAQKTTAPPECPAVATTATETGDSGQDGQTGRRRRWWPPWGRK